MLEPARKIFSWRSWKKYLEEMRELEIAR